MKVFTSLKDIGATHVAADPSGAIFYTGIVESETEMKVLAELIYDEVLLHSWPSTVNVSDCTIRPIDEYAKLESDG